MITSSTILQLTRMIGQIVINSKMKIGSGKDKSGVYDIDCKCEKTYMGVAERN